MAHTPNNRHSFIIRIWQEEKSGSWKGWMQDISSRETIFFATFASLLAFIQQQTGVPASSSVEEPNNTPFRKSNLI